MIDDRIKKLFEKFGITDIEEKVLSTAQEYTKKAHIIGHKVVDDCLDLLAENKDVTMQNMAQITHLMAVQFLAMSFVNVKRMLKTMSESEQQAIIMRLKKGFDSEVETIVDKALNDPDMRETFFK